MSYLAKYPINDIKYNRPAEFCKIKKAIKCIIPRDNVGIDLKIHDQYLQSKKINDDEDENFKAWLTHIQDKQIQTK